MQGPEKTHPEAVSQANGKNMKVTKISQNLLLAEFLMQKNIQEEASWTPGPSNKI